ncbi:MAG: response regulator [Lachnospiraceae bacterium]|nr:response regulator [Lachnospiraceae bacterium]
MTTKRMVITGEKESFMVRVLAKKVQEGGVQCDYVPFSINKLNPEFGKASLFMLFMEEHALPKEDVLHFFRDSLEEKGGKLMLVGDRESITYVTDRMPGDFLYKSFERPIDNAAFAASVSDFFEKIATGEFRKSIMIVDDDPQYLSIVRTWLRDDYKVYMANSGMQAIKMLASNKVDLILLDHEMPITSGPQVLEMLRSEHETKHIPVIFLTGKSDKESVMAVVALRPEGYFLKTIQREELLEKIREFFVLHS